MIRWYDYVAAFAAADIIATSFFNFPIVGAILAYLIWSFGWDSYCAWRKGIE